MSLLFPLFFGRVANASFAGVLYTKGHGLATGCQAAASSGPVGRKLSVSLGSLGFWPKKKKCARAGASGELPTWPVPGLFIKTTTQQLGSTSTLICSMSIAIVVGHVFQLLVCCCYCPLHLT